MRRSIRYMASLLPATAVVATIGLAPTAIAATGTSTGSHSMPHNAAPVHPGEAGSRRAIPRKAAPAAQTASPSEAATEPPPYGVGVDPLVLTDTGADPFVLLPQGDGLAF
jgi:outer membrane receptor protein involved in Fe transport